MKKGYLKKITSLLLRIKEIITKGGIDSLVHDQYILPRFWSKINSYNKISSRFYQIFSRTIKLGGYP